MAGARRFSTPFTLLAAGGLVAASGCSLAPRQQLDDCHRLSQTLRSENAQLKDQMLALRSQNQDFSDRAVDDARRLAQLEESNQRLETSVQAYQDERTRLESAYKELRASLPVSVHPLSMARPPGEERGSPVRPRRQAERDPGLERTLDGAGSAGDRVSDRRGRPDSGRDSWLPSRSRPPAGESSDPSPARGDP